MSKLSARNRIPGTVSGVVTDELMAKVTVQAGDYHLVSVITRDAWEELGLAVGDEVVAVVKATSLMLATPGTGVV